MPSESVIVFTLVRVAVVVAYRRVILRELPSISSSPLKSTSAFTVPTEEAPLPVNVICPEVLLFEPVPVPGAGENSERAPSSTATSSKKTPPAPPTSPRTGPSQIKSVKFTF